MTKQRRFTALRPLLALALALTAQFLVSGCQSSNASSATEPSNEAQKTVFRIGYQKGGAINVLRLSGDLEKRLAGRGVSVEWLNFPAGPQLLEAIGVGSVDLGSTGDAPAVFALAAGNPLVYVANTPPGDANSRAILVSRNSPIRSVKALRGKSIAVQKGSGTHSFLVQALQREGVAYESVRVKYLAPPDARPAFESGQIDAWAIWDPFLSAAQEQTEARVLINGADIISAGGFYLSSRKFAREHADLIRTALEEVDKKARWCAYHPTEAAKLLAADIGVSPKVLERIQRRQSRVGFRAVDDEVMKAQQEVADNFHRIGLIPRRVDVRPALLTPQEYARLIPSSPRGQLASVDGKQADKKGETLQ